MKKLKRVLSATMVSMLLLSAFAGCGGLAGGGSESAGGGSNGKSDKTVLKVGVFNGGLGHEWAKTLEKEFEEKYAKISFENGKEGVDVIINPQKDLFKVATIKSTIQQNSSAEDIYYTCYEFYKEFAAEGLALNMTDVVQEKAYTADGQLAQGAWDEAQKKFVYSNGTMSLEDKMTDFHSQAFYMKDGQLDVDGNGTADIQEGYYALPYETSLSGFIYDHDLFKEKGWLHYSGADGLPETMSEFYELLDEIKQAEMIPYISGPSNYWYGTTAAFTAQYEGLENAELNYTYDGEYTFDKTQAAKIKGRYADIESKSYVTVNNDGSYTVEITPESAYLLAFMPSKEAYVEFCRKVAEPGYFDKNMHDTSYNFEKVQSVFVQSVLGKEGQAQIAMIYEGEWWENEARANFNYTGGYGVRDFRFMPLPKIDGQKTDTRSLGSATAGTHLIINGKTKQKELCRLWLQFAHSEHALEVFTLANGAYRDAFKYDLDATQLSKLSKFGQNVYKLKTDKTDDVEIYSAAAYANCHKFYEVTPMGGFGSEMGSSVMGKYGEWNSVGGTWAHMYNNAGDLNNAKTTVEQFMEGVYNHYSTTNWSPAYQSWKNTQGK